MAKVKIGVMGCATIAKRSVIPAIKHLNNDFELVAVSSRTKEKVEAMAIEFGCAAVVGYENLLRENIDAVYIPLPTGLHEEWVNKSLLAGKHVYAEKSIALTFQSAMGMVENARKHNLALMEGYMFLYHSQHDQVKSIIQAGEIGEIRSFRSAFGFPPLAQDNFRYDHKIGGGVVFDAAGYAIRAVHHFLGYDFEVVASSLSFDPVHKTHVYGDALLKNKTGLGAHVSFGFDNFYQCNYEFWGSKGRLVAERAFTPGPDFQPSLLLENEKGRQVLLAEKCNHFVGAMREFSRIIKSSSDRYIHYNQITTQSRALDQIIKLA
ncbi:MAG: Gfo/Idh/MocA family oxidoreductase [Cyclobacteriaceae bacterium]